MPRSGIGLNELLARSLADNVRLHARYGVGRRRSSGKLRAQAECSRPRLHGVCGQVSKRVNRGCNQAAHGAIQLRKKLHDVALTPELSRAAKRCRLE